MSAGADQREEDPSNGLRGGATKDPDLELLARAGKKPRGLKVRMLASAQADLILASSVADIVMVHHYKFVFPRVTLALTLTNSSVVAMGVATDCLSYVRFFSPS